MATATHDLVPGAEARCGGAPDARLQLQSPAPNVPSRPPVEQWWDPYFRFFGAAGQPDVLDSRRRARILIIACHGALTLMLLSTTLRITLGMPPPSSYWLSMIITALAMTAGPIVLRRTGSLTKAATLPIAATATTLPLMALGAGGLDAPVLAILPAIPLVAAFFVGSRGAMLLTGALMAELGLLALALQSGLVSAGPAPPFLLKATLYASYMGLTAFIAVAYEHERRTVEHRLSSMAHELYETSIRDHLTNVSNRRYFSQRLDKEISFGARHRMPLSILILDADRFKLINDIRGHAAGDAVLVGLAAVISSNLRAEDLVARYGGEEFVVLLRGTPLEGACVAAERLRKAVEAHPFEFAGTRFTVTVSIGCATAIAERNSEELLQAADRCLYEAKRSGRNCVVSGKCGELP
jgi:diguanylate cyclase (GGDEF)-like protein